MAINSRSAATDATAKRAGGNSLPVGGEVKPPTERQVVEKVAETDVSHAVRKLSDYVQNMSRELHISVDEESGRTVIRVIDPNSKEVIRQIPQEEILALARGGMDDKDRGRLLRAQA
ncbi:MAG: flagellar protein FlaG [Gammaproteobacteria bacterium]|nr:flagellar protein FlaG [Gammaproteobacteria bacterium]